MSDVTFFVLINKSSQMFNHVCLYNQLSSIRLSISRKHDCCIRDAVIHVQKVTMDLEALMWTWPHGRVFLSFQTYFEQIKMKILATLAALTAATKECNGPRYKPLGCFDDIYPHPEKMPQGKRVISRLELIIETFVSDQIDPSAV